MREHIRRWSMRILISECPAAKASQKRAWNSKLSFSAKPNSHHIYHDPYKNIKIMVWSPLRDTGVIFKQPSMNSFDLLSCHNVCLMEISCQEKKNCSSNQSSPLILTSKFFSNKRYKATEFYQINLLMTYYNERKFSSSYSGWLLSRIDEGGFCRYDLLNPLSQANILVTSVLSRIR